MGQDNGVIDVYLKTLGSLKADCIMAEAIPKNGVDSSDVELLEKALRCLDDVLEHHGFRRGN